jgi:hypothetical protein
MRMKLNAIMLLILSILLSCGAGCTDSGRYAVSLKTSTLGLGGEFTTAVAPKVNARVGINTLNFDYDGELEDIDYDLGFDFFSVTGLVDWYVFDGSFRLSGGVLSMDHKVNLDAIPTEEQEIGNTTYTPAEIGTLSGCLEIDQIAPYVGIGWGNPLTSSRRWGFTCDFGVAFISTPDVSLSATGPVAGLAEDLIKEQYDIEDDLEPFKYYPVIAVSFFYRF